MKNKQFEIPLLYYKIYIYAFALHTEEKHIRSMMLPPPCLKVAMVFPQ